MPTPSRSITLGLTVAVVVMGVRLVTDVAQPSASVGAVVIEPVAAAEQAMVSPTPSRSEGQSEPAPLPAPAAAFGPDAMRRLEMGRYLAPDGLASLLATDAVEPPAAGAPQTTPAGLADDAEEAGAEIPAWPLAPR